MPAEIVTRDTLRRALVLNAAKTPLALAVGGVLLLGAAILTTWWLVVVALLIYAGLATATFFDGDVAERVGQRVYADARSRRPAQRELPADLRPDIRALIDRARTEETRIFDAIAESELPFEEVSTEVESLAAEMERVARRAHVISSYLDGHSAPELRERLAELRRPAGDNAAQAVRDRAAVAVEDQLRVHDSLQADLDRFRAEMEELIASLGVVHAQLVRISVTAETDRQEELAGDVRSLRQRISTVADRLSEPPSDGGSR
jgi:hypothetical protein